MNRRTALKRAALLLGGTLSAPAVSGFLSGCQPADGPDWEPAFLSGDQLKAVEAIVDRIIPPTETPGAKELGVGRFVDQMLAEYYLETGQQRFLKGLEEMETLAQNTFQTDTAACSAEQQDELLTTMAERSVTESEPSFFTMIKELTVLGFFTTEVGATEVIQYELTPGGFTGCAPLEEVGGKTWAT